MSQRDGVQGKAILMAGGLTAFALVLVLAVAGRVAGRVSEPAPAPSPAVASTAAPPPGPDQAVQALIDEREAAYQQIIRQANDRLAEANRRLAQAQARPAAPAVQPAGPAYIGADVAAQIALLVAPGSTVSSAPELVNFQGTAAYEVVVGGGSVYVDARSGQVLYNGVAAQVAQGGGGGGGGGGGSIQSGGDHGDEEHEGEDHEDDGRERGEHAGGDEGGERDG